MHLADFPPFYKGDNFRDFHFAYKVPSEKGPTLKKKEFAPNF